MAKAKAKATETKPKRAPKPKKDSYLKDNYVQINDENGIRTDAMHVRGKGCLVRETHKESGQVTSTWVPDVKVKTKKDWKYLIIDKGPKKKKGQDDESEEESDD